MVDAVLARRIARAHGWQRTGSRIRERIEALAAPAYSTTKEDVGTFYWPNGVDPLTPVAFRRSADATRAIDEICMEELVALAREVLVDSNPGGDDIVAMARRAGLHALRAPSRARLEQAMQRAVGERPM